MGTLANCIAAFLSVIEACFQTRSLLQLPSSAWKELKIICGGKKKRGLGKQKRKGWPLILDNSLAEDWEICKASYKQIPTGLQFWRSQGRTRIQVRQQRTPAQRGGIPWEKLLLAKIPDTNCDFQMVAYWARQKPYFSLLICTNRLWYLPVLCLLRQRLSHPFDPLLHSVLMVSPLAQP